MTSHMATKGDSGRCQGSRSDHALHGLSLTPVGIATHPRTGALRTVLSLRHLSAKGACRATGAPSRLRAHAATRALNAVAPQARPLDHVPGGHIR